MRRPIRVIQERNERMLADRLAGMTPDELAVRYDMTANGVYQAITKAAAEKGVVIPRLNARQPRLPKAERQPRDTARAQAIYEAYANGANSRDLSLQYGVSKQRIYQIIKDWCRENNLEMPKHPRGGSRKGKKAPWAEKPIDPELLRDVLLGKISAAQAARVSGLNPLTVAKKFQEAYGLPIEEVRRQQSEEKHQRIYDRWQSGEFWANIALDEGLSRACFWQYIHRHRLNHGIRERRYQRREEVR